MTRFIAFYLPQYYPTKENDLWWGKGFTEWTNVARAKRLFPGHNQPHIPADLGFYDLRLEETRIAQAELAAKYGVEGFCYWHYWFGNGKRLLERPFNEMLDSGKPNFPFCLAWANHSWEKKQFDKNGNSELICKQEYPGEQDYTNHFNTMLPAFKDSRYIKVDGKILFFVYTTFSFPDVKEFISIWRKLAKQNGLNNFYFVTRDFSNRSKENLINLGFDATYNDDVFNIHHHSSKVSKAILWFIRGVLKFPTIFLYRKAIRYMVMDQCKERDTIPLIAPNWDHSPRSGGKAILLHKNHPRYFYWIAKRAIEIVKNKRPDEKIVLIKSWNEWGEGNYLEPDLEFGTGNLEALRRAIDDSTNDG